VVGLGRLVEQVAGLGGALVHLAASHMLGGDSAGATVCRDRGGYSIIGLMSWK
jgi:hypothetical protein